MVPDGESGEILVTASRTGGSDGAISVSFTTRDDSALETTDYVAATGTLEWADGDTEDKTISVPLVDDLVIESSESLVIELEPSNDVTIGTSSVTATIVDDDHQGDSYAVTSAGRLVHFDRVQPGRLTWSIELSGLGTEKILGIDIRPADGLLYALTDAGKLYTIDPATGAATLKSTLAADAADTTMPFTGLAGSDVGIDFNPVVDRLRVTSNMGQNLRINVDTGAVTTDDAINGLSTGYGAVAYNNNVAPACRTTLYAIDVASNRFLSQNPPNAGTANGIGGLGVDATESGGFDVVTDAAGVSSGFAVLTVAGVSGAYSIDLASGAATELRAVGPLPASETIVSFSVSTLPAATPVTQLPGELFGATATDVVSFNRAAPAKLCTSKTITGLAVGDSVVGIDMRPSTGVLYVLAKNGTAGKLHRVDPATGNLSPAIPVSVALQGTEFGMDFNPTGTVPLRIISNTGQNIRVTDLTTGAATADTALNGAGTTATGSAYTDAVPGAGTTTLYAIDATADRLRIQNPPNSGTLVDVGPLGVDVADVAGFDIDGRDNSTVVVVTVGASSQLHTIDLTTGALSASLGTIAGAPLRGVTRATPQTNVFGVTTDNKLVRINLADPSMVTVVSDPMLMPPVDTITGLAAGEQLVGVDVRPGSNVMYGVGSLGAIYTLNASTANANNLGMLAADPMDTSAPYTALSGTSFGVDFNPLGTVPLRVVSNTEQNLRIPNVSMTPRAFTDTPLSPGLLEVTAAAYSNSFVAPAGVTPSTTLYVIDVISGQLMIQNPPNNGTLTPVGLLGAGNLYDATVPSPSGFDIAAGNNGIAIAAFQRPTATPGVLETFSRLYRINLATGAATEIGTGIGGAPLRGLTVQIR
ncbi:MAG: Calx-beta protein [Myxococcales bacterium]|nr:Calx-beta protein [Myxococcales bacterium]